MERVNSLKRSNCIKPVYNPLGGNKQGKLFVCMCAVVTNTAIVLYLTCLFLANVWIFTSRLEPCHGLREQEDLCPVQQLAVHLSGHTVPCWSIGGAFTTHRCYSTCANYQGVCSRHPSPRDSVSLGREDIVPHGNKAHSCWLSHCWRTSSTTGTAEIPGPVQSQYHQLSNLPHSSKADLLVRVKGITRRRRHLHQHQQAWWCPLALAFRLVVWKMKTISRWW